MVQVNYTKEKGLQQKSGSGSFTIESGIPLAGHIKDTVKSNTVSTLNLNGVKHSDNPTQANEVNIANKYIRLRDHTGQSYYLWFSIADGGVDPEVSGSTRVKIANTAAQLNTAAKIQDVLVARINSANAGGVNYSQEANQDGVDLSTLFFAEEDGANVKVTLKAMGGNSSASIVDISQFVNLTDGDGGDKISMSVSSTPGTGSYLLSSGGISNVSNATLTNGSSFVELKNLTANDHHGARKIVHRPANGQTFILKNSAGATLHTFDAAGEVAHLVWNGTAWKLLFGS